LHRWTALTHWLAHSHWKYITYLLQTYAKEKKIDFEIKPIETKKRYVLVIDQILDLIKGGAFKVGDKLPPERTMASKLDVSRPSVREAYCVLEIVGILESKVGSGTYVKSNDIDQISLSKIRDISRIEESPYEILEVRKIIEPEIVSLAVQNATEEDVIEIERILQKMKLEKEENEKYSVETDALFHLRIAQSAGNTVLLNIMKYINDLLRERLWDRIIDSPDIRPGDLVRDIQFHENVFQCIKTRDKNSVRPIMLKRFNELQKSIE
jgi:GntR family transcriptional repressor for pyruvate dehydrogenase complex